MATPQVAEMLQFPFSADLAESPKAAATSPHPANLPVADVSAQAPVKSEPIHSSAGSQDFSQIVGNLYIKKPPVGSENQNGQSAPNQHTPIHQPLAAANLPINSAVNPAIKFARAITPYVIVFSVAIFLYYFFFTGANLNLSGLFKSTPKVAQTGKQSALAQLEQADSANYRQWISKFYYDVTDQKILDPEADNSGNGITNFQKYLLNLNPKSYDTLGLGRADSESLALGLNPLTGNVLTDQQKQIVDKYFDMEIVMNKLTLANMQNARNVAGASTLGGSGAQTGNNLGGYQNFGNPLAARITPRQESPVAAVSSPPVNDPNVIDIDTNIPGRLEILSLKINVPIMWTDDPKNFDRDLKSGVAHYPGTALPGQIGTAYISGHSSNYVWAGGNYNQVFNHLDNLADSVSFKVTVVQKNGRDAILRYIVTGRKEYSPTDQAQFQNSGKSVIALSTCWPVGSTARRLVVFGQLTQVEK